MIELEVLSFVIDLQRENVWSMGVDGHADGLGAVRQLLRHMVIEFYAAYGRPSIYKKFSHN